jgi:hypothetical protein
MNVRILAVHECYSISIFSDAFMIWVVNNDPTSFRLLLSVYYFVIERKEDLFLYTKTILNGLFIQRPQFSFNIPIFHFVLDCKEQHHCFLREKSI